ncbi:type II toxin-antitoxin system VapC family toxin [Sandarakinorhabdus sp.]|uniref:type II toxin-antitoxin system VapC family toxin n=1 Tax=Sandarakinorhabdus sp. TaxID=1916663 RepID=UPI0033420A9E
MIVDTSALIAILQNEPERPALRDALLLASNPMLPAPAYLELAIVLEGKLPAGSSDNRIDAILADFGIGIAACDAGIAKAARAAFARYGKGRGQFQSGPAARLNFGDCLVYATARHLNLPLLFKGDDFAHTDITPALPAGERP